MQLEMCPCFSNGANKLSEKFSPCFLFVILVTDRICEDLTQRLNPFLDLSDLIRIGGGLL